MHAEENSFERPLEEENSLLSWQKWDGLTVFQCDVLKSRKQWRVLERGITGPLIKINEVYGRIRQLFRRLLERKKNVLVKQFNDSK